MADKKVLHVIIHKGKIAPTIVPVEANQNSDDENEIISGKNISNYAGRVDGLSKEKLQQIIDDASSTRHEVVALVPRSA